jgi:hypothetical protein
VKSIWRGFVHLNFVWAALFVLVLSLYWFFHRPLRRAGFLLICVFGLCLVL